VTITSHQYRMQIGTAVLDITSGQITMDDEWAPYVQGQVTVALPSAATRALMDPRTGARAVLHLSAATGTRWTLADRTAITGGSVSAGTAWRAARPLSWVTSQLSTPFETGGTVTETTARLDLAIIERLVDWPAGEVRLELMSDEALTQLVAALADRAGLPQGSTVAAVVTEALWYIGLPLGPSDVGVELGPDGAPWPIGQTIWDYASGVVEGVGLRLRADESRRWRIRLASPLSPPTWSVDAESLTELEERTSVRDGWGDSVIITYRWTDGAGDEQVHYVTAATSARPTATIQVEFASEWTGTSSVTSILGRATGRGRRSSPALVSNYDRRPGDRLTITDPDDVELTVDVTALMWSLDTDTMQLRTRDLP